MLNYSELQKRIFEHTINGRKDVLEQIEEELRKRVTEFFKNIFYSYEIIDTSVEEAEILTFLIDIIQAMRRTHLDSKKKDNN